MNCIYQFADWKATVTRYTVELQSNKLKGAREDVIKLLRSKANNIYTEVCFDQMTYLISNQVQKEKVKNNKNKKNEN